jgi:hypothetical protein
MHISLQAVLLLIVGTAVAAPVPPNRGKDPAAALEQKLIGEWVKGGACIGDITFNGNGTYERKHFSPGNNTLRGTWKVQWDALPPTLVLTCENADAETFIGKVWEQKLTRLDDDELHFESGGYSAGKFARTKK